MKFEHVLIVGAGQMGGGIAQVVAGSGRRVSLTTRTPVRSSEGSRRWRRASPGWPRRGALIPPPRSHGSHRRTQLVPADLLIEAITEDSAAKEDVFRRADEVMPAEAILASNTRAIRGVLGLLNQYLLVDGQALEIKIARKRSTPTTSGALEDLVLAAVNSALQAAEELAKSKLKLGDLGSMGLAASSRTSEGLSLGHGRLRHASGTVPGAWPKEALRPTAAGHNGAGALSPAVDNSSRS